MMLISFAVGWELGAYRHLGRRGVLQNQVGISNRSSKENGRWSSGPGLDHASRRNSKRGRELWLKRDLWKTGGEDREHSIEVLWVGEVSTMGKGPLFRRWAGRQKERRGERYGEVGSGQRGSESSKS